MHFSNRLNNTCSMIGVEKILKKTASTTKMLVPKGLIYFCIVVVFFCGNPTKGHRVLLSLSPRLCTRACCLLYVC